MSTRREDWARYPKGLVDSDERGRKGESPKVRRKITSRYAERLGGRSRITRRTGRSAKSRAHGDRRIPWHRAPRKGPDPSSSVIWGRGPTPDQMGKAQIG
jgi:hypothetical protein